MLMRLQTKLEMHNITKKQCASLRKVLLGVYGIIAQGACDILEVRHSIADIQRAHSLSDRIRNRKLTGQQGIKDWLIDKGGVSGWMKRRQEEDERRMTEEDVDDEELLLEEMEERDEADDVDMTDFEVVQQNWLPRVTDADIQLVQNMIIGATNTRETITTIDKTLIRIQVIQNLLENGDTSAEVIDGMGRLIQGNCVKRSCKYFPSQFYDSLFNNNK